jgi:hypothetical protein
LQAFQTTVSAQPIRENSFNATLASLVGALIPTKDLFQSTLPQHYSQWRLDVEAGLE